MSKVTEEMVQAFLFAHGGVRDGLHALFDAKLISLPVDESAIRESVVRELRDAVDGVIHESDQYCPMRAEILDCFDALLPTKDRAEELAEEYRATEGNGSTLAEAFRWLIEREGV